MLKVATMAESFGGVQPLYVRGLSVHLIEAQALFVPILAEVFREVGLELSSVATDIDMHKLLDDQPDVLFVDADYLNQEPLRLVNALRMLVPEAVICVYTSQRSPDWAKACHFAGATAVFSKNAERREIVGGMQEALRKQPFTDVRLRDE
jgi:DNA-binding NarL/FixJ family response regulator